MSRTKTEISTSIRNLSREMTCNDLAFALGDNKEFVCDSSLNIFHPVNRWDIVEQCETIVLKKFFKTTEQKVVMLTVKELLELEAQLENFNPEAKEKFLHN